MTAIALAILLHTTPQVGIHDITQPAFKDASFTARVVRADQGELAKINKDFGQAYRFEFTYVKMKEPFMLRLESNVEDTELILVVNGPKRTIRVPKARIKDSQDFTYHPGQRQTVLDFGLLTPSLFTNLFDAKFIRTDRATGDYVFDLTYKQGLEDTSRSRVWVDPTKHYVVKRDWFNQVGRQLATFYYEKAKLVNGVWIPTRLTVRNTDDHIAGVTQYDSLRVNTGLDDKLFQLN